ncbi:MAG: hypothetical protein IH966_03610 [Gemmatimonadetes bacterium]|nr:hypothetical protein [Gemmatimonadota bacterium]
MSTKKAARTRRAEREKEKQHRRRQGPLILAMIVLGVLVVLATAALAWITPQNVPDASLSWKIRSNCKPVWLT